MASKGLFAISMSIHITQYPGMDMITLLAQRETWKVVMKDTQSVLFFVYALHNVFIRHAFVLSG